MKLSARFADDNVTRKSPAVNGVVCRPPDRSLVMVCIDGGDPACIQHGSGFVD